MSIRKASKHLYSAAADKAANVSKATNNIASKTIDAASSVATNAADNANNTVARVRDFSTKAVNTAGNTVNGAVNSVRDKIDKQKQVDLGEYAKTRQAAIDALDAKTPLSLLIQLGDSPYELTHASVRKTKDIFPIPREQTVLWVDAEFDLRPSGIAITNCGVFIKTDVNVFGSKNANVAKSKSILYYYRWEDFEPSWCVGEDDENIALSVDSQCSSRFVEACSQLVIQQEAASSAMLSAEQALLNENQNQSFFEHAVEIGAMTPIAHKAKYAYDHAKVHNPAGHGEMVENAHNMIDRIHGSQVTWEGTNNVKGGADRIVDGVKIQTKYYKTWRGSLDAAFDQSTGKYIYKDMQLEVPKDQYDNIVEGFRRKIKSGKVDGVSDPAQAEFIVRKGKLTYQQAVNLTKPGTIESLLYDAGTGAVICTSAFGITFIATMFGTYKKTGDLEKSVQAGVVAGVQVFGTSFVQHMLTMQVSRTGLADAMIAPSTAIVQKMGHKATQVIVNGLRALSGKTPVYGAAASKHLAKVLRGNVVTAAVTMAVFSVPEAYKLANNKISGSQFTKNIAGLTGSVTGGIAGMAAAGAAAAKVAGVAGTTVAPGVGTVVGITGGFIGGAAGSIAVNTVSDIFIESDTEKMSRLFNAMLSVLICEYLLDENETTDLVNRLNQIDKKEFKKFFEDLRNTDNQEKAIRVFLTPLYDEIIKKRKAFHLPSSQDIEISILKLADEECR